MSETSAPPQSSYLQILRSTSIVGGGSILNLVIGLVRLKVAALLLGAAGFGVVGILGTIMTTAVTLSGMGFGNSGVRELAAAAQEPDKVAQLRRMLLWAHVLLAIIGAALLWTLRNQVASWVFGDASRGTAVGWLGVGVICSLVAGSQLTILQGLRRVGDMARAGVVGATLGAVFGIAALWIWTEGGVVLFVISGPIASLLAVLPFAARLPRAARGRAGARTLIPPRSMIALGMVTMTTALMANLCQLLVRALITRELGVAAVGHFHAAWTISMTYLGFVLAAMGADYYPRLAEVIHERELSNRLVNEQTKVALLLAGPAMIGMIALAPWLIPALYASDFADAVGVLRWQVLGDVLKVSSWPMAFILMARGRALPVLLTELLWMVCYSSLVWIGLPIFGIEATGVAFLMSYAVYLIVVFLMVRGLHEFRWTRFNALWSALLLAAGSLALGLALLSPVMSAIVGSLCAGAFAVYSVGAITRLEGVAHRLARLRGRLEGQ